jgi:hypothetical protein
MPRRDHPQTHGVLFHCLLFFIFVVATIHLDVSTMQNPLIRIACTPGGHDVAIRVIVFEERRV